MFIRVFSHFIVSLSQLHAATDGDTPANSLALRKRISRKVRSY